MKEESVKKLLTGLTAAFMILFSMTPFLYMLFTSVNVRPDFLEGGWFFTLSHYRDVLGADSLHFLDYLKNSILVSAAAALITVLVASVSAFAITRLEMKGKLFVLFSSWPFPCSPRSA